MAEQKPQVIDAGANAGTPPAPAGKKGGKTQAERKAEYDAQRSLQREAKRVEAAADAGADAGVTAAVDPEGTAKVVTVPKVDYDKIQGEREQKVHPGYFTIYKKGQGYWTRMGTAIAAALIAALTAFFLFTYTGVWLSSAPDKTLTEQATQEGERASHVATSSLHDVGENATPLAAVAALLVLLAGLATPMSRLYVWLVAIVAFFGVRIAISHDALSSIFGTLPGLPAGPPRDLYTEIAIGVAAAFVLLFGLWIWRLMNKPSNADFLIATDSEMKKVNWTTKAELIGSTKVVIFFMFMIAIFLFAVDTLFGYFFQLIKVLQIGPFG